MKRKNTITDSLKKKGKELNLDAMKQQVQALHTEEESKKEEKARNVRMSVDAPENVYLALKGKVLRERTTIKKYVLNLIEQDLGFK